MMLFQMFASRRMLSCKTHAAGRKRQCSEATGSFLADKVALSRHPEAAEPPFSIDQVCESENKRPRIDSPSKDCKQKNVFCQTLQPPKCVDKATWVSKSLIANSPTKKDLRNIIKELKESHRKEIKLLKQTAQRRDKLCIATLKDVTAELTKQKDLNLQELEIQPILVNQMQIYSNK